MNKRQELERADKERGDLAFRRDQIRIHLRNLDSNIALLKSLKIQYENNIRVLKNPQYITTVEGYKKVKDELQTIIGRMSALQVDYNNHQVLLERVEKMLVEANERYAIMLKNQDAQVIQGKFGGKERDVTKDPQ